MQRWFLLILGCAAGCLAGVAETDESELAARCNAIPWVVPLGTSDEVPPALRELQHELIDRGARGVDPILDGLPDSLNLRRIAARPLARFPSDHTRSALVAMVRDPDDAVASSAALALGEVGGAEVIGPLLEAVRSGRPRVVHDSLNSLSSVGAADMAFGAATRVLNSTDAGVRQSAMGLLSRVRGRDHLEGARKAIRERLVVEGDPRARSVGVRALSMISARLMPDE